MHRLSFAAARHLHKQFTLVSLAPLFSHADISRIEALDKPHDERGTNLVVVKMYEAARARALQADAALARGESWGRLHGVPMTVKENFAIKGVQTTCGNLRYATLSDGEPYKPDINATVVDRVLAEGAIIMGKTNLPTDAADMQSYNEIYGTSRNPWNLECTPGGSSGGSAGAVAAGFTPFEIGSDIGGSIRTPCHFSGVCGHKPTQAAIDKFGMCPPYPLSMHQEDLAVAGPICRSADDLALMLDILSGPDPHKEKNGWSLHLPAPTVTTVQELRVAVWEDDEARGGEVEAEYALHLASTPRRFHLRRPYVSGAGTKLQSVPQLRV